MKFSLDMADLSQYVTRQLDWYFPDNRSERSAIESVMPDVLRRVEQCFVNIRRKYYFESGETVFNHLNSDHYAMFLYILANQSYRHAQLSLAEKAFYLNKAMNGIDAFYAIELPEVFLFVHPVGTVLGNAQYLNYFVVYQNVAVGSDLDGTYPRFGEGVVLYAKSSVIGDCRVGSNVVLGTNAFARNDCIEDDTIFIGRYPNTKKIYNSRNNVQLYFR